MFGMCGKLVASEGMRGQLAEILLRAAAIVGDFPGCHLYAVSEATDDSNAVWVMELWEDQQRHDLSLQDERVRALIAEAMPLLGGPPDGAALRVIGGHGLPR